MAWRSGCYNCYLDHRAPAEQWPRRSICRGATLFVAALTLQRCRCGHPVQFRKRCSRTSARVVVIALPYARKASYSKDPPVIRRLIFAAVSVLFVRVVSIFVQKTHCYVRPSHRGDLRCGLQTLAWQNSRSSARPVAMPVKPRLSDFGHKLAPFPYPLLTRTFVPAAAPVSPHARKTL